jgi:hypothetical protein
MGRFHIEIDHKNGPQVVTEAYRDREMGRFFCFTVSSLITFQKDCFRVLTYILPALAVVFQMIMSWMPVWIEFVDAQPVSVVLYLS